MNSPRSLAFFALLATAAAAAAAADPYWSSWNKYWGDYNKKMTDIGKEMTVAGQKIADAALKMASSFDGITQKVELGKLEALKLDQIAKECKIDTTNSVVHPYDVMNFQIEELNVQVQRNNLIVRGMNIYHVKTKTSFREVRTLPANTDAAAVTATLTADDFLLVNFPILPAAGSKRGHKKTDRRVPIEKCKKTIEGARPPNYEAFKEHKQFQIMSSRLGVKWQFYMVNDITRLIVKTGDAKKDRLRVIAKDGFLFIFSKPSKKNVMDEIAYSCELPRYVRLDAVKASLTRDGFLVVELPLGAKKAELLSEREVRVEESKKRLSSWGVNWHYTLDTDTDTDTDFDVSW